MLLNKQESDTKYIFFWEGGGQ